MCPQRLVNVRCGDQDTVSLSMVKAREMLSGMDYFEEKVRLALAAATKLDQWNSDYVQADLLHNQVVLKWLRSKLWIFS